MGLSRSRTLLLVVWVLLAALSLWPDSTIEAWADAAFAPARLLGDLALPLRWLSCRSVRAAEAAFESRAEAERAAGRALLAAAQTSALPARGELARGRGLVHAEVVGSRTRDRVVVRFAPRSFVEPGMPVVCGDSYVGRVAGVDPLRPGEAIVDLVTSKLFRVGGAIEPLASSGPDAPASAAPGPGTAGGTAAGATSGAGPQPLLVVGGLIPETDAARGGLLLEVHCPSDRSLDSGLVRVLETDAGGGALWRGLADGYLLGSLERTSRAGASVLAVRALLDYAAGLYQVAILCPPERAPAGPNLAQDPFVPGRWLAAEVLLAGDPSFWREGRVLAAGRAERVTDGAALACGASLVGRVIRAGSGRSTASLLGDPGLAVSAVAAIEGRERPAAIGRLVSLGRDPEDGALLLRWGATIPLEAPGAKLPSPGAQLQSAGPELQSARAGLPSTGATLRATLYTSSGAREVPPGLRIGETRLPCGRGPFVLRVEPGPAAIDLSRVRVWIGPSADEAEEGRP